VEICLVTLQNKTGVVDDFTPILNAGVVSLELGFTDEFKVSDIAALPDEKGIPLCRIVGCRLTNDAPIDDLPESVGTFPVFKRFPVEQLLVFVASAAYACEKGGGEKDGEIFRKSNHDREDEVETAFLSLRKCAVFRGEYDNFS
jgi:hypothetical protein